MHLDHHALFASVQIPNLGHSVSRSPNLQENLALDAARSRCYHQLCVFRIARGTAGQVGLMFLSLRVRQVGPFVGV